MQRLGLFGTSVCVIAILASWPAIASVVDTPTCKRALAGTPASAAKPSGEALCSVHRQSLLETVRTRAVIAACKLGNERDQDVARLDGAIETINVAVANTCGDS